MLLEAAIDNFNVARQTVQNGATRLEVCSDLLFNDGLTPEVDLLVKCKSLNVPCFVMIRPQTGSFIVDKEVFLLMQQQIKEFKSIGVDGFVIGALTKDNKIDIEKIVDLVKICEPLPVTFHKAIDVTNDILLATQQLLKTGVKRILTSGGKPTVEEGIDIIKQMYNIVGNHITLVAGGKVNYNNIKEISKKLPFCEYHGKNIVNLNIIDN